MSSILTFYSFKGGVGRSMALANIGYLLATKMSKRVLCVDWDLEAPGLEKYFGGCPGVTVQPAPMGGLIDLLTSASRGETVDWRQYVSTFIIENQRISLIASGQQDAEYAGKVLRFDWHAFFENSDGGAFIEKLRDDWHQEYDFTLIDSRTGFTDSGGVCTVQLPDILVPVFTTTDESARGAIDVVERAHAARQKLAYDRSRLLVFPLPSRYDGRTQYKEAKDWLHRFAEWFGPYYADWLPPGVTPLQVIERTKLPYIGYFSFGTQMPVAVEGTSDPESLGFAYNIAATIIGNDFQQVEGLIAAVPDSPNQPSREELAILRMRRKLQESEFEWRSIDELATAAGIGVTEALDLLRKDPEVDIRRGTSGRVIARIRDTLQKLEPTTRELLASDPLQNLEPTMRELLAKALLNATVGESDPARRLAIAERIETLHEQYGHEPAIREQLAKALTNASAVEPDPARRLAIAERIEGLHEQYGHEPTIREQLAMALTNASLVEPDPARRLAIAERIESLHEQYGHEPAIRKQLAMAFVNATVGDPDLSHYLALVDRIETLHEQYGHEPNIRESLAKALYNATAVKSDLATRLTLIDRIEVLHSEYGYEASVREQLAKALFNATVGEPDPAQCLALVDRIEGLYERFGREAAVREQLAKTLYNTTVIEPNSAKRLALANRIEALA